MQESIDRFLSYTSLQKVLKLILPPNNRHFLSNHRVFRLFNDKRPAKIPNIFRKLIMLHGWTWCGLDLFFRLMNVAIYFLTFQCLAGSKKKYFRATVSGHKNFTISRSRCRENFVYSENGAGLEK